jgi:hypothetical protein
MMVTTTVIRMMTVVMRVALISRSSCKGQRPGLTAFFSCQ